MQEGCTHGSGAIDHPVVRPWLGAGGCCAAAKKPQAQVPPRSAPPIEISHHSSNQAPGTASKKSSHDQELHDDEMTTPTPPIPPGAGSAAASAAGGSSSFLPLDTLFSNPLFAGGLGLASLGYAATLARRVAIRSGALLKRRLLVSLEVSKNDDAYPMLLAWLSLHRPPSGRIATALTRVHDLSMRTARRPLGNGEVATTFLLQPGYGRHVVRFGGAYLAVHRERKASANLNTGEPFETLTLTTLYAHRHIFEDLFGEAYALSAKAGEDRTPVLSASGTGWAPFGEARRKRPLGSVILDKGVAERVLGDVREFWGARE
ncbi:hypothetical protein V498_10306, partial [Pseudogymnoascus sp. VKM F-4517 (FW-2822)]